MTVITEPAYAKLNLTLDVLGIRPDGYHDLKSVMLAVSLHDSVTIELDTGMPWSLVCDDPQVPADERNLAWKAAKVFYEATKVEDNGIRIHIKKHIPSQAGMGGGSSDAAAVLRALNRHYDCRFSLDELCCLGEKIGSDVPFCVLSGTAMAEGRGERLRRLPKMPHCVILICKPNFPVSTPALFKKLDSAPILRRPDHLKMEDALDAHNLIGICENICNVFQPVVAGDHTEIGHICGILSSYGALAQQMTGSGATVYGIMPDENAAFCAMDELRKFYSDVFLAYPV